MYLSNNFSTFSKSLISSYGFIKEAVFNKPELKFEFPETIAEWKFVKEINNSNKTRIFGVGLYESFDGHRAVLKLSNKRFYGYYLLRLKNESYLYKLFNKEQSLHSSLRFPKLLKEIEFDNHYGILIEFIDVPNITKQPINEKINIYLRTVELIRELGKNSSIRSGAIPIRDRPTISAIFLFLSITALLKRKQLLKYVLNSIRQYFLSRFAWVPEKELVLSHRDLHFENILYDGKQIYLIDLELMSYSFKDYEELISLTNLWFLDYEAFEHLLISFSELFTPTSKKLLTLLPVLCLSSSRFEKTSEEKINKMLNLVDSVIPISTTITPVKIFSLVRGIFYKSLSLFKIGYYDNNTIALCYHSISDQQDGYAVSERDFRHQIELMSKYATFVDIKTALSEKKFGTKQNILITFDDGFKDLLLQVPFLDHIGVRPIVFIISDSANCNRQELNSEAALLNETEIRFLIEKGWDIGCHSSTHSALNTLSEEELFKEIVESKISLEKRLGINVKYFSYPKGLYNPLILKYVEAAGYKAAFTVDPGSLNGAKNKYLLPRTIVNKSHAIYEFPVLYSTLVHHIKQMTASFRLWERYFQV